MDWLQSNWVWIALGLAFVAMHLFGHGGHGRHGGHGGRGSNPKNEPTPAPAAEDPNTPADGKRHRHDG